MTGQVGPTERACLNQMPGKGLAPGKREFVQARQVSAIRTGCLLEGRRVDKVKPLWRSGRAHPSFSRL